MELDCRVPEQRVDTHLCCAEKLRVVQKKRSPGLVGSVTARGRQHINEVDLERARTSKKYRFCLEQALADLLFWVSLSTFASLAWLDVPLLTNQVLCEWIQHTFQAGGKISLARHGIIAVQTARRELNGKVGEGLGRFEVMATQSTLEIQGSNARDLDEGFLHLLFS